MNILVAIHDLTPANAHLMPWRTVCEVVRRGQREGDRLILVSLGGEEGTVAGAGIPDGTLRIPKEAGRLSDPLQEIVRRDQIDVIVWPVVWREPFSRTRILGRLGVPLIGYFPGGVYGIVDVLYAVRRLGVRKALPYIAEAFAPRRLQIGRWRRCGFVEFLVMTAATARAAVNAGWPGERVCTIPPGREEQGLSTAPVGPGDEFESWVAGRPYFLFAGPPSGIRGIYELLTAFDLLAGRHAHVCLVCLFRSDAPLEEERLKRTVAGMRHRDRVYCIWTSLERARLEQFMSGCRAIVLPFVAVPSEIPLAIIEAMRFSRPVITTMTGGSGEYVSRFGDAVRLGDTRQLARSMSKMLDDEAYYRDLCGRTGRMYEEHPTWNEVADAWRRCAARARERGPVALPERAS